MDKRECIDVIRTVKVGYLATCNIYNQPFVRPVDMGTIYDGNIYFSTFDNTEKVKQLAECNKVEAIFIKNYNQIRIIGTAELITDIIVIDKFLADNKSIADMLHDNTETNLYIYKICPKSVNYMGGDDKCYSPISWR